MALIRHSFFPQSMFEMDTWFNQRLSSRINEMYNRMNEIDRIMRMDLDWRCLDFPDLFNDILPEGSKVNNKFRINLNCSHLDPYSIRLEAKGRELMIKGKDGNASEVTHDFKKSYKLPESAETDKMASIMNSKGELVVEIPIKEQSLVKNQRFDLFPKIVESEQGKKMVKMNLSFPENIDPSNLTVTCKEKDLIIKAEQKSESQDSVSSVYFYRRTTLPENTDFNSLKCQFDKNCLSISADLSNSLESKEINIPIEYAPEKSKL